MSRPLFDSPAETPVHPTFPDGTRWRLYEFPNGWGASVVSGSFSYGGPGLWELAVTDGLRGELNYGTPITDEVIGWLDEDEVEAILNAISKLPVRFTAKVSR